MKKNIILIILFVLCFSAYPNDQERIFVIRDFSGGLASHISPFLLKTNQSNIAQNVRFNKSNVYGGIGKRIAMRAYGTLGSYAITGLHRYYKNSTSDQYLIASGSTFLKYRTDSSSTYVNLKTGLSSGKRWQFTTYDDIAIGMNGTDSPVKWDGDVNSGSDDGDRTADNLCAELGAPFANCDDGGTDLDNDSWYMYKVAFYDGTLYTYSTARSNPLYVLNDNRNIALSDIPLGASGTTHRYIYRTLGNSSKVNALADTTYYLVATLSDNTTLTYLDGMTDDDADNDASPTWSTVSAGTDVTPPIGKYCQLHEDRLFIAGNSTNRSEIYWSELYNADYFDTTSYATFLKDDGDEITFIKPLRNLLVVGKTNSITLFYTDGNPEADWYIGNVMTKIGCHAPYSAINAIIKGSNAVVYMNRAGLYAFTGSTSYLISDIITPEIQDVKKTDIENVAAIYANNTIYVSYTSSSSGDTINNRVIVYETERNAYSVDTKNVNTFTCFNAGTDEGVVYMGSSDTDGYVWADQGSSDVFVKKYKSEVELGTFDDCYVSGEEISPVLKNGVDDWANAVGAWSVAVGTWYMTDTSATWISPTYEVNASIFDKLYWNETLNNGDITFQINTGSSTPVSDTFSGTSYTNQNGSDISAETADTYIRFKISFTANAITSAPPQLSVVDGFLFKVSYSKSGTTLENSFLSIWQTGFSDILQESEGYDKVLTKLTIFYRGAGGTLSFYYDNIEGTCSQSLDIDLSTNPNDSSDDRYYGRDEYKMYYIRFPVNNTNNETPRGTKWRFKCVENGTVDWDIDRIVVNYTVEPIIR